jgi:UrcA family protein
MNTETKLPRRSSLESAVLKAALVALCAIPAIKVMADTPPAQAPDTLAATVSLANVDFSTPEGQRIAYERLQQTARHLCSRLEDMHMQSLGHHPAYIKCVDETIAHALRQFNGAKLAANEKSSKQP